MSIYNINTYVLYSIYTAWQLPISAFCVKCAGIKKLNLLLKKKQKDNYLSPGAGGNTGWVCWVKCCGNAGLPATCRSPAGSGNWAGTHATTGPTSPIGSPSCRWPSSSYHSSSTGLGPSGWISTKNLAW